MKHGKLTAGWIHVNSFMLLQNAGHGCNLTIWAGLFESWLTLTQDWKLTKGLICVVWKWFSPLMFCVVWDYSNSALREKQHKQKSSLQSYKKGNQNSGKSRAMNNAALIKLQLSAEIQLDMRKCSNVKCEYDKTESRCINSRGKVIYW